MCGAANFHPVPGEAEKEKWKKGKNETDTQGERDGEREQFEYLRAFWLLGTMNGPVTFKP